MERFTTRIPSAVLLLTLLTFPQARAESDRLAADVDRLAGAVEEQVVTWRRDIHQHPELGNREFRTAALVADHLRPLAHLTVAYLDDPGGA